MALTVPVALPQQWSLLTSGVPWGRYGHSAVYNAATNQIIVFGGVLSAPGILNTNDTWRMDNANGASGTPAWTLLLANGSPGGPAARHGHAAVYDAATDRMIVFGGCLGGCLPVANDVWVLVNATGAAGPPTWQQLSPVGGPPAPRTYPAFVYDPTDNRMILFGGQNGGGFGGATYPDVWVLSNANGLGGTPAWTQLAPTGGPAPGQYGPSAIYDQANNIMTVFGGGVQGTGKPTNSVWTLSHANGLGGPPAWTRIVADGAPGSPARRAFPTATYDPASNRMTIYGGINSGTAFGDFWILQNANGLGGVPAWIKGATTTLTRPVPRTEHRAVYDPASNRMMVICGQSSEGLFYSTWALSNANGL